MTGDEVLTTSPLLFGYCGRNGRLTACDARAGARFRLASGRSAEIVDAFLEPRSVAAAVEDGFTPEELQEARDAGILVSEEESEPLALWERNGWSRPAYLVFSQMDIPYRESSESMDDLPAMNVKRRAAIEEYGDARPYPEPGRLAGGRAVDLPDVEPPTPRLSALTARRSARGFSPEPPSAEEMAGVLRGATDGFRTVAADRAGGDPYRLLNSFYSWAHPFVVVQEVAGVARGTYEYDWKEHRLLEATADPPTDAAVLACAQGQRGVLGTGFVVFVVADLGGYAWLYRHSRAYLHVLIQVGELGQEILMAATELGLVGWTTPAIHESRTAALLGLPDDDSVDVLSMVKLGRPTRARTA